MKLSLKSPYVKKETEKNKSQEQTKSAISPVKKQKSNKQQTWRKHFSQHQPQNSVEKNTVSLNLRAKVIELLLKVDAGQSLAQWQDDYLNRVATQDKALFHELSVGVLRHWFALKQITLPLSHVEIEETAVAIALYVGVYQIIATRIADHASIAETVEAVKQLGFTHASGLVNAVLRRAVREREHLQQQFQQSQNLPSWLAKRLKRDWTEQFETLVQQLKTTAPLTLRINQRQISRDAYAELLNRQQIAFDLGRLSPVALTLRHGVHIPSLVGFEQGYFSVQDEHAQLVNVILSDLDDQHILDACAAPGGKTAHLLEQYRPTRLQVLELDEHRAKRIDENLQRLQLNQAIDLHIDDACTWQGDALFDVVILDAPCTATGVIRRHPDIRLLRKAEDVAQIVELQKNILNNLWKQVKVGGRLLYITCSILKAENEQQMIDFFANHADAIELKIDEQWGIVQQHGRQLFPTANGGDGFYYCLIQKNSVS